MSATTDRNGRSTKKESNTTSRMGTLMIHNAALFVDLVESLPPHPYENVHLYNETDDMNNEELDKDFMFQDDENDAIELSKSRKLKEQEQYQQRIAMNSEKRRQLSQQKKDEKFVQLYNSLLEDRAHLMNNLVHTLNLESESDERKKQEIYVSWVENVFNPIQEQIDQKLESTSSDVIERRRRKMFEQFLEMSNKKPLFRDIILPQDDYNPIEQSQKYSIKYTKSEKTKKSKQREVLDIQKWARVDATPHGHYVKEHKQSTRAKEKLQSNIKFDHYSNQSDTGNSKYGKRVNYEPIVQKNSKRSLADLSGFANIE
jgi:hypothetical protein